MVAIAVVMLGLGLSLTAGDFTRALAHRRVLGVALLLQILLLPTACYGLALVLRLPPIYATGLLLLAAAPGGITANLYTHLFHGEVALSITLMAITTWTSMLILPLTANLAIHLFAVGDQIVPIQASKMLEVMAIVLIPVLLGMVVRVKSPTISRRTEAPVKILGMIVLAIVVVLALMSEWRALRASFSTIGFSVLGFNVLAIFAGYFVSRRLAINQSVATAVCFQTCVRNTTIPLFVAINVLGNFEIALPAALYSILMHGSATLFGRIVLFKSKASLSAHH
jgi:bile acid:Na+ symporter, BASS family